MQAIIIGLDLAKHSFQVHGVDAAGKVVVKRRLRRAEVSGSSRRRSRAWSAWRPSRPPTIGRAS